METFKTSESIQNAAAHHPNADLRHLLSARIASLSEYLADSDDLLALMHVIVMEDGDTALALEQALSVPVLTNGSDLSPGATDFIPSWEICEAHAHWYEITYVLSSDGFGVVVYVPKTCTDATLLGLCERFAQAPATTTVSMKEPHEA